MRDVGPAAVSPTRRPSGGTLWVASIAAAMLLAACTGPAVSGTANPTAVPVPSSASGATTAIVGPSAPSVPLASARPSGPQGGSSANVSTPSVPAAPAPSASPSSSPPASTTAPATPTPAPSPSASPLPQSQHGFRFRDTVVPMLFPLPASARYAYVNNFLAPRLGAPYPYNNVRGTAADGSLLRAHDGVDVYVKLGTPVAAPFSGTVIDPATRWKPWDPAMYGRVVAIVSDEPASTGYAVLLVHLSRQLVSPGDHVRRGQRVGFTGNTGNAAGTTPHLHVELRAPFLLRVREFGVVRRIDAFDPFPSLVAADPRRTG